MSYNNAKISRRHLRRPHYGIRNSWGFFSLGFAALLTCIVAIWSPEVLGPWLLAAAGILFFLSAWAAVRAVRSISGRIVLQLFAMVLIVAALHYLWATRTNLSAGIPVQSSTERPLGKLTAAELRTRSAILVKALTALHTKRSAQLDEILASRRASKNSEYSELTKKFDKQFKDDYRDEASLLEHELLARTAGKAADIDPTIRMTGSIVIFNGVAAGANPFLNTALYIEALAKLLPE